MKIQLPIQYHSTLVKTAVNLRSFHPSSYTHPKYFLLINHLSTCQMQVLAAGHERYNSMCYITKKKKKVAASRTAKLVTIEHFRCFSKAAKGNHVTAEQLRTGCSLQPPELRSHLSITLQFQNTRSNKYMTSRNKFLPFTHTSLRLKLILCLQLRPVIPLSWIQKQNR